MIIKSEKQVAPWLGSKGNHYINVEGNSQLIYIINK
jgi:hypothetical protein